MPDSEKPTCSKWMPRKQAYCARKPDHKGDCRTAEALADNRQRLTERRRGIRRRDDPAAKAHWNKAHKFVRLGITEERFNELLEAQGRACGICREPFEGGQRVCIDHDHNCCPVPPDGHPRSCGRCVRGLLCVRCNTWLGWMEMYGEMARTYLDKPPEQRVGQAA
jgi:hypothetical protein